MGVFRSGRAIKLPGLLLAALVAAASASFGAPANGRQVHGSRRHALSELRTGGHFRTAGGAAGARRRLLSHDTLEYAEVTTPLSEALQRGEDTLPGVEKQPLDIQFVVVDGGASRAAIATMKYQVLPALRSLLARSVRVRRPSGTFSLEGVDADYVEPQFIPDEVTADLVIVVTVEEGSWLADTCVPGAAGAAITDALEVGTGRPLLGALWMCSPFDTTSDRVLEVAAHEVLHILAWSEYLIPHYWAFSDEGPLAGQNVTTRVETDSIAPLGAPAAAPQLASTPSAGPRVGAAPVGAAAAAAAPGQYRGRRLRFHSDAGAPAAADATNATGIECAGTSKCDSAVAPRAAAPIAAARDVAPAAAAPYAASASAPEGGLFDYDYDYFNEHYDYDYTSYNSKLFLSTPQVTAEARRHFGCPSLPGALGEDSAGFLGASSDVSHLESSVFYKNLMQGVSTLTADSYDTNDMTDLELALLQDTGWYDVKYGTAGFSTHGYLAGCAFGEGDGDAVRADPSTAGLVCSKAEARTCSFEECIDDFYNSEDGKDLFQCLNELPRTCSRCTPDHRGTGTCYQSSFGGFEFVAPMPDREDIADSLDYDGVQKDGSSLYDYDYDYDYSWSFDYDYDYEGEGFTFDYDYDYTLAPTAAPAGAEGVQGPTTVSLEGALAPEGTAAEAAVKASRQRHTLLRHPRARPASRAAHRRNGGQGRGSKPARRAQGHAHRHHRRRGAAAQQVQPQTRTVAAAPRAVAPYPRGQAASTAPAGVIGYAAPAPALAPYGAAAGPEHYEAPGPASTDLTPTMRQLFSADCAAVPGSRCVESADRAAVELQKCHDMRCDGSGQVLIDGQPCDPSRYQCPDAGMMCSDPGLLTCLGDLQDCNGRGTCFRGFCYCHLGWGGARCDKPLCQEACPDGTKCPLSGFCGEPECGKWSEGQTDRGTPCNFFGSASAQNATTAPAGGASAQSAESAKASETETAERASNGDAQPSTAALLLFCAVGLLFVMG